MLRATLLSLQLFAAVASAPAGLYSVDASNLVRWTNGAPETVGPLNGTFSGVQQGAGLTAVVPENQVLYALAMAGSQTRLYGFALANASTAVQIVTPISQTGKYVGQGQTIHYAGDGKLVITAVDLQSNKHTAWSVDTSQTPHTFTVLSDGFLQTDPAVLDNAHTYDSAHGVFWTEDKQNLIGIDVANGTEIARNPEGAEWPHAMEYDATSNTLLGWSISNNAPEAIQIDTTTFKTSKRGAIDPSFSPKSFWNGLSAFDESTRSIYGMCANADGADLLITYSASTGTTSATVMTGARPMNFAYYNPL